MNTIGTITDQYDFDAFGTLVNQVGSTPNAYLYSGEQNDSNLGFYYLRARYLNQSTGRFWTMDSFSGNIFDPESLHRYLYAGNNPANRIDPSGNLSLLDVTVAAFVIGVIAATVEVHAGGTLKKAVAVGTVATLATFVVFYSVELVLAAVTQADKTDSLFEGFKDLENLSTEQLNELVAP